MRLTAQQALGLILIAKDSLQLPTATLGHMTQPQRFQLLKTIFDQQSQEVKELEALEACTPPGSS